MLQAGKGVRVPLTMDLVEHVMACMEELQEVMDNFIQNPDIAALITELTEKEWTYEKDKYGHCFWVDFPTGSENTFRIKVVIDSKGNARLDFRDWWEAS